MKDGITRKDFLKDSSVAAATAGMAVVSSESLAQEVSADEVSYDASDFVLLTDVVPDAILEIRYYSTYNFVGARVDGYEQPCALLSLCRSRALTSSSTGQTGIFPIYPAETGPEWE